MPGNMSKSIVERLTNAFNDYALTVDTLPESARRKFERDVGHKLLVIKMMVHVDAFRHAFPGVHPSGFSASSD